MIKQTKLFSFDKEKENIQKYSFSKIELFLQCPLRYELHYIEGKPHKIQNLFYLNVGRNVHEALKIFFSTDLEKRSIDYLMNILEEKWNSRKFKNELESKEWLKESKAMLFKFFREEELKIKPTLLEASFKVLLKNSLIIGKIDRVDKIGNNKYEIIDYKIGDKEAKISIEELRKEYQWIFYWLGLEKYYHIKPNKISYYFLASGRRFEFSPAEEEVENNISKLNNLIFEICNTNKFMPKPNRECMSCLFKSRYCPI